MKPVLFIASAGILAAVTGTWQYQRLRHLDFEIASHRLQPLTAGEVSPRRPLSVEAPRIASTAGAESIPEALALLNTIKEMNASLKNAPPGTTIDPEDPVRIRWGEIIGSMGLDAALKLIDAIDDRALRDCAFGQIIYNDPGLAFQMKIADPDRKLGADVPIAIQFGSWSLLDPGGAIRWFRAAEATHSEMAADIGVRVYASVAEAGIDPSRCVRGLPTLLPEAAQSREGQQNVAAPYAEALGNNQVRLQFLQALNEISQDSGKAAALTEFRKGFLKQLNIQLHSEPVPEATSLMDATYTPEEKQAFAIDLAGVMNPSNPRAQEWLPWLASLDLPADSRHPLALMATEHALKGTLGEPNWLDHLPAGEVKNQVIVTCVKENRYDSALALRYLAYLPAGPEKDELAASRGSAAKPGAGKTRATIGPSEGK